MGAGSWTTSSFIDYSVSKGMSVSARGVVLGMDSNRIILRQVKLNMALDPRM
mgnify:CR=1 FL=1